MAFNFLDRIKKSYLQKADFKNFLEDNGFFPSPADMEFLFSRFDFN